MAVKQAIIKASQRTFILSIFTNNEIVSSYGKLIGFKMGPAKYSLSPDKNAKY